jgi:hypothetical protein
VLWNYITLEGGGFPRWAVIVYNIPYFFPHSSVLAPSHVFIPALRLSPRDERNMYIDAGTFRHLPVSLLADFVL